MGYFRVIGAPGDGSYHGGSGGVEGGVEGVEDGVEGVLN